ncbi:MAG: hypothetical protein ACE5JP_02045 [Candidatus Bipolaricaulia bacterium]
MAGDESHYDEMVYNQEAVDHMHAFEQVVESAHMPEQTRRKIFSILNAIEYQVEEGTFPHSVVGSLRDAILHWTETLDERTRNIVNGSLELCVEEVLRTKQLPNQ